MRVCQNPECGQEYEAIQANSRYCSRDCADAVMAARKREGRNGTKVDVPCEGPDCTVILRRTASTLYDHVFCSRACRVAWKRANQESRKCCNPACGRMFLVPFIKPTQRFCCKACAREVQNALSKLQKEQRATIMGGPDERDVASELGGTVVKFSSLWGGKGMDPEYNPLAGNDIYVGY